MIELMTQPSTTPAHLLFLQCFAASSKEGKTQDFIRNEITGHLLDVIEPMNLTKEAWQKTLDRISLSKNIDEDHVSDPFLTNLPSVLQKFISKKKLNWKKFSDVKVSTISSSSDSDKLELIYVKPGGTIPQHTHEGKENFLVLHGSYSDEYGSYMEGTMQTRDESHDHKPIGNPITGCIGLAYTNGKIKFSGKFSKVLNFFNY